MPLEDEKLERFNLIFLIYRDDGVEIRHSYHGLNDLELAQQVRSVNDVIIDLLRQGCDYNFDMKVWKEED